MRKYQKYLNWPGKACDIVKFIKKLNKKVEEGRRRYLWKMDLKLAATVRNKTETDIKSNMGKYDHTYAHNWSLQPFSQDYNLATHIIYIMCVNFIHEWWHLQFKVDSKQ